MRIFVYLLALLTGFSAAQASQAKVVLPASLDAAEAMAETFTQDAADAVHVAVYGDTSHAAPALELHTQPLAVLQIIAAPRVYRGDRSRE